MSTTTMIGLGILSWVLMSIPLALAVARVGQLTKLRTPVFETSEGHPIEKPVFTSFVEAEPVLEPVADVNPVLEPMVETIAGFPAEPPRFVGRAPVMAGAGAALAPVSGRTAVVFHGMAGVGKTTCAVELAYRHQRGFVAMALWSAPTDPDQFGDALRLLAVALEAQLADYGFAMLEEIATLERLQNFLPTLTAVFADADLLLVLDNLDTLLTPEGQWRDPRWAPLIGALTDHQGSSRVILTSRIVPAGLNPDTALIQPVHALSRKESVSLIRRLPHLRALSHSGALGRDVLTATQGHPQLLELANAAAADPPRLAYQLAEIEQTVDETAPLAAFLTEGHTRLDAEQLLQIVTAWTVTVTATLPAPARLLLQTLCRLQQTDRNTAVLGVNWPGLWRRLDQPGQPAPLASTVASLIGAALIGADPVGDPADPNAFVPYRIHPGIVEAIHSVTPQPVTAAVDAQLAAWWTIVGGGGIDQQHTGNDINQFPARANLAAAHYLLRQHHYNAAGCLLERTLIQQGYSSLTALTVVPLLRRIAEATEAPKDLVVLGAALRKVDPGQAEILLRRAYEQARTDGDHGLASTTSGELVTLLRDQDRLQEALTLAGRKIEHSRQAGFGRWTQLSDHGRRLQILQLLGHHGQVLTDLPALRTRMADLPELRADNDRVNPYNAREGVLDIGRLSAVALQRWDDALELNDDIAGTKRRRGASPHEVARTRFHDYIPLLRLGRLVEVDHLLRECQDVFDTTADTTRLAAVYGARAGLQDKHDHPADAVDLQRTSLRLCYAHPHPHEISTAHRQLATYLSRASGRSAEQCAHRLTAALIDHLTGDTHELARTREVLAGELRSHAGDPDAPRLPTTLPEITRLVDGADGIHLGDLLATLCPDPATVEHALTDLLTTAANSANRASTESMKP